MTSSNYNGYALTYDMYKYWLKIKINEIWFMTELCINMKVNTQGTDRM